MKIVLSNPLIVQVVSAGSRKMGHLAFRCVFLGVCLIGFLIVLARAETGTSSASLGELARAGAGLFANLSWIQVLLICLLGPLFTGGAITQQRHAQTLDVLLTTPMSNAQIVIGSLIGRLSFVLLLALGGLPFFLICRLYGGVTLGQILTSFGLAAAAALVTGSLAVAIGILWAGKNSAILVFYLISLAWLAMAFLEPLTQFRPVPGRCEVSWLTGIHPLLALSATFQGAQWPRVEELTGYSWPIRYYLARPALAFISLSLIGAGGFLGIASLMLRAAGGGRLITVCIRFGAFFRKVVPRIGKRGPPASRHPRSVWANSIAWREAVTRAGAGARGRLMRLIVLIAATTSIALLGAGLFGWIAPVHLDQWLAGTILVEFTGAVLLAGLAAATAITREKEARGLDLLIVTGLSTRYYLKGKLRGLAAFLIPLWAAPVGTIWLITAYQLVFGHIGFGAAGTRALVMPVMMAGYLSLACVVGMQVSLRSPNTIRANLIALALLLGGGLMLHGCIGPVLIDLPRLQTFLAPVSPYTLIPLVLAGQGKGIGLASGVRAGAGSPGMLLSGLAAATGLYLILFWAVYRNLVSNFTLVIRRQMR